MYVGNFIHSLMKNRLKYAGNTFYNYDEMKWA